MGELQKEDRKDSRLSPEHSSKELSIRRSKSGGEVDKVQLKQMVRELSESIVKNTKEMLR